MKQHSTLHQTDNFVFAFTDGACSGNPGPGGWAAILIRNNERKILRGHDDDTTNQKMELTAAVAAAESVGIKERLTIVSDSQYVIRGMNEWLAGWKRRGWKNAGGRPVANRDLWTRLDQAVAGRSYAVRFKWVRGHAGDPNNALADRVAVAEAAKAGREKR